jgi:hypothetical protein
MSRKIKFVTAAVTALALAAPAASMASQPANPGGFGQERSANIHTYFTNDGYGTWGNPTDGNGVDGASDRKGDNSLNTTYMRNVDNSLPAESNAGL